MSNQKSHLLLQVGCLLPYELHLLGWFVFHVLQMGGYAGKGLGISLFLSIPSLLGEKQGWWAVGRKLLSISFTVLTPLKTQGALSWWRSLRSPHWCPCVDIRSHTVLCS